MVKKKEMRKYLLFCVIRPNVQIILACSANDITCHKALSDTLDKKTLKHILETENDMSVIHLGTGRK